MSKQLLSIQKILHNLGIDGYYRPTGPDRHLAQLSIEILTGDNESNHLEICEVPIPDSELFLLQWFVQLPLCEPFAPNDPIPSFQQSEVLSFCAELNQILPVGIFNVFEEKLCFRHIFVSEIISQNQIEYLLSTIETLIQRCQPLLQEVAIGTQIAETAISDMDDLFASSESDSIEEVEEAANLEPQINDSSEPEPEPDSHRLTLDEIASQTLSLDDEDEWNLDSDFVVFDESNDD